MLADKVVDIDCERVHREDLGGIPMLAFILFFAERKIRQYAFGRETGILTKHKRYRHRDDEYKYWTAEALLHGRLSESHSSNG